MDLRTTLLIASALANPTLVWAKLIYTIGGRFCKTKLLRVVRVEELSCVTIFHFKKQKHIPYAKYKRFEVYIGKTKIHDKSLDGMRLQAGDTLQLTYRVNY